MTTKDCNLQNLRFPLMPEFQNLAKWNLTRKFLQEFNNKHNFSNLSIAACNDKLELTYYTFTGHVILLQGFRLTSTGVLFSTNITFPISLFTSPLAWLELTFNSADSSEPDKSTKRLTAVSITGERQSHNTSEQILVPRVPPCIIAPSTPPPPPDAYFLWHTHTHTHALPLTSPPPSPPPLTHIEITTAPPFKSITQYSMP